MVHSFSISLPNWCKKYVQDHGPDLTSNWSPEAAMDFVYSLAMENVRQKTGGPFGAAVFDLGNGALVSVGVNIVVHNNFSSGHAEIVALGLAQQALATYNLGSAGSYTLVSSTEPCAMCMGAVPWGGVSQLVCGARDEDARAIGFDEGYKGPEWVEALESRGIEVIRDVLRQKGKKVLETYREDGGTIYNGT